MRKLLVYAAVLFMFSVTLVAQEKVPMVPVREGHVDWSKEISREKLFHGIYEITLMHDWELVALRVALVDAAISSNTLAEAELKKVKGYQVELLHLELALLAGAANDTERLKGNEQSEKERAERISAQKKKVFAALNEAKQQL